MTPRVPRISQDRRAIVAALAAALLFGAGTPAAKPLLESASPWLLAGLLYLGSGAGLLLYRLARRLPTPRLSRSDGAWLGGAIVAGGLAAPILLMQGLAGMPASGAALLLNAEGVLTALLAWFVFRENFDRRIAAGMVAIVLGAIVVAWQGEARVGGLLPALFVVAACLFWAVDNNLTRKVALADASFIAMAKGLAAGTTNVAVALALGDRWPEARVVAAAMAIGFASYGASLTLFVLALRGLGAARTGAYFSIAPFAGAVFALGFLGEPMTAQLAAGGALMAVGVWLHVTERHSHAHRHAATEHSHEHVHDDAHHGHPHDPPVAPGTRHSHPHRHEAVTHEHAHFPDAHHRHDH